MIDPMGISTFVDGKCRSYGNFRSLSVKIRFLNKVSICLAPFGFY